MPSKRPTTKAGKQKAMKEEMGRFKRGELHSGSPKGPKVKNRAQAIAIGLKESGQSNKDKMSRRKRLEGKSL